MSDYGSKTASGNSRLFNCLKCNKAFTREEHLTRHILSTHNKLKPFICGICSRPFSRRDLLLRHAKNLHKGLEKSISRIRKLKKALGSDSDQSKSDQSDSISDHSDHEPSHQNLDKDPNPDELDIDESPGDNANNKLKMSVNMLIT